MREPGAILLVACYELGHQPMAVAWPAAFLERAGFAPAVLDLSVEPFDEDRVAPARLVAISVPMHTALRLGVTVVRRVRALNPRAHVALYGHYAVLNAAELLASGADTVLGGEAEEALVALARRLEAGQAAPAAPAPATVLARLDFPVPSRAALPSLGRYARLEREGRREVAGHVEASRGCRHRCRHCPIPAVYGGRFFVVPVEVCLADVRQQVAAGATHVTFGDPDFLNGPGHALAVARAVHAEFPALTFDFTAKVEHLLRHRRHLPELVALGGAFVVTAAESLSDAVLARLDKGHTRADVGAALHAAREAGLAVRPTWVPFTPWSTLEDYRELLDVVEREDLVDAIDPVQYSIRLLVPPGSLLLDDPALRAHLGPLLPGTFHHRWVHPDPRMDRLQAAVAEAVAAAAARTEDPAITFGAVRGLAARAAGVPAPGPRLPRPAGAARVPRLTESWFC
jgi:radical SAM superfamily enzyme YgiQ (UPF0313 family)